MFELEKGDARAATPTRQQVLYELANSQRALADEQFLSGDRESAGASYTLAKQASDQLNAGELGLITDSDASLLSSEIAYRQTLLTRGFDFWGVGYSEHPINPAEAYSEFTATLSSFSGQIDTIRTWIVNQKALQAGQYLLEGSTVDQNSEAAVADLSKEAADTKLNDVTVRSQMLLDRLSAIQSRQAEIGKQIDSLHSQMTAQTQAINQIVTSALISATGLPPNTEQLLQGAAQGDVSSAIKKAALSYAASNAGDIAGPVGDLARGAQEAAADYESVKTTIADAQAASQAAGKLVQAVKSRNTRDLLELGQEAASQFDPALVDQLQNAVAAQRTVTNALLLARNGTNLRGAVAQFVAQNPALQQQLLSSVQPFLNVQAKQFDTFYAAFLNSLAAASSSLEGKKAAVAALTRAWADSFISGVLASDESILGTAHAIGLVCQDRTDCATKLKQALVQSGLSGPAIQVAVDGTVIIQNANEEVARFKILDLARLAAAGKIEADRSSLQADIQQFSAGFARGDVAIVRSIVETVPDNDFDSEIAIKFAALSGVDSVKALSAISGQDQGKDILSPALIDLSIGKDVAEQIPTQTGVPLQLAQIGHAGDPGFAPGGGPDPRLLQALTAFGPYGTAAAIAVRVLSGIEALGQLADQVNAYSAEDRSLTAELIQLAPFRKEMEKDEALAEIEGRIATAQAAGAEQHGELLQSALVSSGQYTEQLTALVRGELPLVYYRAELLREQFDRLDRSLALWTGVADPNENVIEQSIRDDPAQKRLALDPDIRLFDWFDRTAAGQRSDLDLLQFYWNQMGQLATDACNARGCNSRVAAVGIVTATESIRLSDLVRPTELKSALASGNPVSFTLTPSDVHGLTTLEDLRLVRITAAIQQKRTGSLSLLIGGTVQHSGLGYVVINNQPVRETLAISQAITPDLATSDSDKESRTIQGLQVRWFKNGFQMSPVEGYPLFGLYQLNLPQNFNADTQDVVLLFYFQYPRSNPIVQDKELEQIALRCGNGGQTVHIDPSDLRLVIGRSKDGLDSIDANALAAANCSVVEEPNH